MIEHLLLKITARCNLNCDYCYVFNMGDQSWENLPKLMSEDVMIKTLDFIEKNFSEEVDLNITFHGGEPLMYGPEPIKNFINLAESRSKLPKLSYSIQTNMFGNKIITWLKELDELGVLISASTDGDKSAMDLHRKTHTGSSSFDSVHRNLVASSESELLCGIISVIDSDNPVANILEYLSEFDVSLELLPIDTNWDVLNPKQIIETSRWFSLAFLLWVTEYPNLDIRYFRHIVERTRGNKVGTDAFGSGILNLISIEPDGSIHGLDVLKAIGQGQSNTGMNVFEHNLEEVLSSEHFLLHSDLIKEENFPESCLSCSHNVECHGGSVPHRWNGNNFKSKSAHCATLHALFSLTKSASISDESLDFSTKLLQTFVEHDLSSLLVNSLENVFPENPLSNSGPIFEDDLSDSRSLVESGIIIAPTSIQERGKIYEALVCINKWNPVFTSFILLSRFKIRSVELVSGPTNSLLSLTDSRMKDTILINSKGVDGTPLDVLDIAENIVHETTHLMLDGLLSGARLSTSNDYDLVIPWRDDPRDTGGVIHGTLVFWVLSSLRRFHEDFEQMNEMRLMVEQGLDVLRVCQDRITKEGKAVFEMMENGEYC